MKPHASLFLHESPVHSFRCAVLLRSLLHSEVTSNALLLAKLHEPVVAIFTSIVTVQVLDLAASLVFDFGLPFFELFNDFRFLPHEVDPDFAKVVIYEDEKIASTTMRPCWCWPPYIGVNVVENRLCTIVLVHDIEQYSVLLPERTVFAEVQFAHLQTR